MRVPLALAVAVLLAAPAAANADGAELVTVTTTGAEATWHTSAPSDTTVCVDAQPCATQEQGVTEHHATLDGLQPGSTHAYVLKSAEVPELVSPTNPGRFMTLTPPPGRKLFAFAVMNDLHVGEQCAGTAVNAPLTGTSVPPCFSAPDYAARMDEAEVDEIKARGIDTLLVDGDVTSEARPEEATRAKEILDRLGGTVLVARGNHDRVHADRPSCGTDGDCFRTAFYPGRAPGRIYASANRDGVHFVVLDSVKGSSTGDLTDAAQNEWLRKDLAANRDHPTFIAFHHPASVYGDTFEAEPIVFGVPPQAGGSAFESLVRANPQVVGVLQAHTHRNFNTYGSTNATPFIEGGAAKEYPGGYSVFTMYEGGYTRSYVRPKDCTFCREWTRTTAGEYFGLAPQYVLGSIGTRNFTHVNGCDVPTPPPSLPGNALGDVVAPPARCLAKVVSAGTPAPDEGAGLGASFALTSRTARVPRGRTSGLLSLRCTGTPSCGVTGTIVTTAGSRTLTLARARGTVRDGATGRVRLTLTARGRRALAARPSVRARARVTVTLSPGDARRLNGRITLRR